MFSQREMWGEDGLSAAVILCVCVCVCVRERERERESECSEDGQVARMTLGFVLDMPKGVGTAIC